MKYTDAERTEARTRLLDILKPGDTVYTVLKHVSRSGMMRRISLYTISDGRPVWLDNLYNVLDGEKRTDGAGIKVGGCGMDMGFHLVHCLAIALYPDGFDCTGERCPSNDHSNGDRNYSPHHHKSLGYALRHEWM